MLASKAIADVVPTTVPPGADPSFVTFSGLLLSSFTSSFIRLGLSWLSLIIYCTFLLLLVGGSASSSLESQPSESLPLSGSILT